MKTARLDNGMTVKFPSNMSDLEVQAFLKKAFYKKVESAIDYTQAIGDLTVRLEKLCDRDIEVSVEDKRDIEVNVNANSDEILSELKKITNVLMGATNSIEKQTSALVEAMTMQADVMAELVVAYREPKKITRDSMGRPEGIE
jgi:hypothetical protein